MESFKRICTKRRLLFRVLGLLLILYTFIEPYWLEVKVSKISNTDIPDEFSQFRIVFVSDIHLGPYFSRPRLAGVVRDINRLRPDLVVLGGDYILGGTKYVAPCFEELGLISAPFGIYAVLGNHDNWEATQLIKEAMHTRRITLIDNSALWILKQGKRIKLGGVGDYWTDEQDLTPTLRGVKENDFVILVSHNPDYCERLTTKKIDLVLCGHTHGGQVTFFGLFAPLLPTCTGQKYRTGLVKLDNTSVLISNGIGTVTPPMRFFARPQINLVILD
jgi:predicted MPP superfamily phosphohydrolase